MHINVDFNSFKKILQSIQIILKGENSVFISADKEKQQVIAEAGYNGVYIKRIIETEVLETGSLSIDSTFLTGLRITGVLDLQKINEDTLKFKCKSLTGNLKLNQTMFSSQIDEEIINNLVLDKKEFLNIIKKVNFLESNTQEGIHIKINNDYLMLSAFDRIKMALYEDKSLNKTTNFNILINPNIITKIISYINENKLNIGSQNAIVKIETPSFLCYFPTIQMEPEDIKGWLEEVDMTECQGTITTTTEYLLDTIKSIHSIAGSNKNYDLKLLFKITNKNIIIVTESEYGSAEALVTLLDSDIKELSLVINSQHLKEMLEHVKSGVLTIKIWEDYIILYCLDNKYTIVIPLISDNLSDQY